MSENVRVGKEGNAPSKSQQLDKRKNESEIHYKYKRIDKTVERVGKTKVECRSTHIYIRKQTVLGVCAHGMCNAVCMKKNTTIIIM